MPTRRVAHPRIRFTVVAVGVIAAMSGCLYGPPYDQLLSGDAALLELARETYTDAADRVALAVIDGDDVRTAFVSADDSTRFDLGSAARGLTGLLLQDAIARGEATLDDPVSTYLDLDDAPAAELTLRDLATHHSGLPQDPLAPGARQPPASPGAQLAGSDRGGLDELLRRVEAIDLVPQLDFNVSDFDAALVGQALAAATGVRFADLLEERVLVPAGMTGAVVAESVDLMPDGLAQGHDRRGRRMGPVGSGAYSPAVGVVVTLADIIALARAILEGPFADSGAFEPIERTRWPQVQIGLFWERIETSEGDAVYVVGEGNGFTAAVLVDPDHGTAAVLLSNAEEAWPRSHVRPLLAAIGD
ncbi:serine hydrolase domain-containing protein [Agromyces sp. NPDC056523]|uniref:serine hydrolase domain-containing protein n=1 Tax=Agromyces sp. NPDC056523 TaxID=3345850 RepID=UPI00366B2DCF